MWGIEGGRGEGRRIKGLKDPHIHTNQDAELGMRGEWSGSVRHTHTRERGGKGGREEESVAGTNAWHEKVSSGIESEHKVERSRHVAGAGVRCNESVEELLVRVDEFVEVVGYVALIGRGREVGSSPPQPPPPTLPHHHVTNNSIKIRSQQRRV